MGTILLIVLLLAVFGGLPNLGYHSYGYGPSGIGGVLLLVVFLVVFLKSDGVYDSTRHNVISNTPRLSLCPNFHVDSFAGFH